MGTTYYATKTATLFSVHQCSKCKSIVLTQFELKASSASTWSKTKAMEAASEGANHFINALQDFYEKPFLVTVSHEHRSMTTAYEAQLLGIDEGCPCCGGKETWQRGSYYVDACKRDPETGLRLVPECPEASRMRVFGSLEQVKAYAGALLNAYQSQMRTHWAAHPQEAQALRSQIQGMKDELSGLETRKTDVQAKSRHLFTRMQKKEEEMKGYSLFSSDRRNAKGEYKDLKKQYEAQLSQDQEAVKGIDSQIKALTAQLQELQYANPGIMDQTENIPAKGSLNRTALRYS